MPNETKQIESKFMDYENKHFATIDRQESDIESAEKELDELKKLLDKYGLSEKEIEFLNHLIENGVTNKIPNWINTKIASAVRKEVKELSKKV